MVMDRIGTPRGVLFCEKDTEVVINNGKVLVALGWGGQKEVK